MEKLRPKLKAMSLVVIVASLAVSAVEQLLSPPAETEKVILSDTRSGTVYKRGEQVLSLNASTEHNLHHP